MNPDTYIPFSSPDIGTDEIAEVTAALQSGWITSGPRCAEFERNFRDYAGAGHALAVNSCTAGLHVALAALGIGPGDEVITTPFTFCATVNTILTVGATPVLADIDETLNISPGTIRAALTERTRAIIPVHMAGLPCDLDAIWHIATRHRLAVVEDAAHAAGAMYRGRPVGSGQSDAVAFSFYATKNLTTGEGGMVTTQSEDLHAHMKTLCLHGISRDAWNRYSAKGNWFYEVVECGFKYNMSDIMAAIGLVQLRKLERMTLRRAEIAQQYNGAFADVSEFEVPPDRPDSRHSWHLYVLRLNLDHLSIGRDEFLENLRQQGIGCSVHFIPIPLHRYYRDKLPIRTGCGRALREYPRMLSLPLHTRMSDADVQRVIGACLALACRFGTQRQSRMVGNF